MNKQHVAKLKLVGAAVVAGLGGLGVVPLGHVDDRGCVACGTVYTATQHVDGVGDATIVIDQRGRYWCLDCATEALGHVRRRNDERTDYKYPWTFDDTGGLSGQHASVIGLARGVTGKTHTIVSPSYNADGTIDRQGPKLVQTFTEVAPGVLELVREFHRGLRDGTRKVMQVAIGRVESGADNPIGVQTVDVQITRAPEFSYKQLGRGMAQVVCTCGWSEDPMPVSPFDPNEALAAAQSQHPKCKVKI